MQVNIVQYDQDAEPFIRHIRDEVFIQEQGIDPDIEFDGLDNQAVHTLIIVDGEPAATGRMLSDGHIGRVAVKKAYRGSGIGAKVVSSLIEYAASHDYPRVYLGAQKHAIDFYTKLGFLPFGDEFVEAGIVHLSMEKCLA
ncbi:GNAT family N-acetyltransferase [Vibrio nitrifigilis]|uniref:GNAT family N-acetyltransferase n=1 Tax=Vibrio nitrifigilis TaxID=2789781 RepID=A0ABS0GDZ9_9VIBR|nr:GNAT family N-acetyltransferase [Vibrio nitrifigilis]MBF9000621.1 GNAT family N-acetyltransferase [Vibrio nitrifigilis]